MLRKEHFILLAPVLALALSAQAFANPRLAQTDPAAAPQVNPRDYNVLVLNDERVLVMMAALNVAGYDYDPSGRPSGLRAQMREDLKGTDPALVSRLRGYYSSHRSQAREEIAQASPYIGLALTLSAPPVFGTPTLIEKLPADVREVVDFAGLLREFYTRSAIRQLLPKYRAALDKLKADYERTASAVLFETLSYLRTEPVLYLPPTPIFSPGEEAETPKEKPKGDLEKGEKGEKKGEKTDKSEATRQKLSQPRVRRLLIFLNPFAPPESVFERNDILNGTDEDVPRRLGDDYCIVASEQSLTDYIRHGFLRFVLDPIVGKSSVDIANLKDKITPLLAALPQAREKARRNVYEVVGESLARAVGVRLTARTSGSTFTPDDAAYVLSQSYEQGAVLVFHFYEGLQELERVGIDVRDFVAPYLAKIDFEREAKRLDEARAARARVEQRRAAVKSIVDVDEMIKQRQYAQAQTHLEAILKEQPHNARALFGMAQIVNNQPTRVELDESSTDEDKIAAQEERLSRVVKLYREAIAAAGPDEQWLVSQCHVLIGRIYDFVDQREAALAEYEKAIKLGDIPKGAYREALEGKAKPHVPANPRQ